MTTTAPATEPATETTALLSTEHDNERQIPTRQVIENDPHAADDPEHADSIAKAAEPPFARDPEIQRQLKWILPATAVGIFMVALDQTIIVSSYGAIGSELHVLNLTSWIAAAYLISLTSFQPLYGKLSDIWGRKSCLLFAYGVFGLGSLLCGLAQTMPQLIAARLVQGIGGGGIGVVVSILVSDIVPLKDRGVWQGILNVIFGAGTSSGAAIGGLITDRLGWRWIFLLQVPLSLVASMAVAFVLRLPSREEQNWKQKLKRIDFPGAFTLVFAVIAFLIGMDRGSNVSWRSPLSYGFLAASLVLFLAFVYNEKHFAKEPFAPTHLIFTRAMLSNYLLYFFSMAGWLSLGFYLPLYFQIVNRVSATEAGLRVLPSLIFTVVGSLTGGIVLRATGKYYWLMVSSMLLLALSVIPIILFSGVVAESYPAKAASLSLFSLGGGIGTTAALIALIAEAGPKDQPIATACAYLFRGLGCTVGVSLASTVIQQVLRSTLLRDLGDGDEARDIIDNVRESLDYLNTLDPKLQDIVRHAYALAFRHMYVLCFVFCLLSFISTLFVKEKKIAR